MSKGRSIDDGKREILRFLDLAAMAEGVNGAQSNPIQRECDELDICEVAAADTEHRISNMNMYECTNACFDILNVVARDVDVYVSSGGNGKGRAEVYDERNGRVKVHIGRT